ncbi:DUF5615 family PIN-like protein [Candidatus Woesearchaeota archaeon]|nr:DUF5615 family PIN-like protein [Candidatus Woesearchaeota archaeon]
MHKFLVDESAGKKLVLFLLDRKHDAVYVGDIMPKASDMEVIKYAENKKRILITNDKDFGEFIFRLKEPSSGVILLRLKQDSPLQRQKYVYKIISQLSNRLSSSFIVVTEGKIRIRRL